MLSTVWQKLAVERENDLATRSTIDQERWSSHTHDLPPLRVGDHVFIQNQTGNYPKRWDRRGVVIEVLQYHQYKVRVDGSRSVTLRNRQYLRKFKPYLPESFVSHNVPLSATSACTPNTNRSSVDQPPQAAPETVADVPPTPRSSTPLVKHDVPQSTPARQGIQLPIEESRGQRYALQHQPRIENTSSTPIAEAEPSKPSPLRISQQDHNSKPPTPPLRRYTRANKGRTSKYSDYTY